MKFILLFYTYTNIFNYFNIFMDFNNIKMSKLFITYQNLEIFMTVI